jgi:hypothetical protein
MKYLLIIISILFCFGMEAQTADIRSVEQKGQKIYISYDLKGNPGRYNIKLFVKSNNSYSWSSALKSVSGNVGANQTVGINKQIVWDVLRDRDKFQGDWVFGIEAVNLKKEAKLRKKVKKEMENLSNMESSSFIGITSNFTNNPFGLSYGRFKTKNIGWYIDIRTDFRIYAPGEWALRDRSWIIHTMDGIDTGFDLESDGCHSVTYGIIFPISRSQNKIEMLHIGLGLVSRPVFDEFYNGYNNYYAKGSSNNFLNLNIGFVSQRSYKNMVWGVSYDFILKTPTFMIGFKD